jgi:hypothetical protein
MERKKGANFKQAMDELLGGTPSVEPETSKETPVEVKKESAGIGRLSDVYSAASCL